MKNKADKLNILRFTAFIMIFLLHSTAYMPNGWDNMPHSWMLYTPAWAGTWIFFTLAGYGVGASLCSGKYDPLISRDIPLLNTGLMRFYLRRLMVLVPIYWLWIMCVAIFVQSDILRPGPTHIRMLIKLLLFDYQEEFCQETFGVAWYITTLMRLYLIAPLIYFVMMRLIKTRKCLIVALSVTMLIFFGFRILMWQYYRMNPPDMWSIEVYKPFWFNLDLFACGMMLNLTKEGHICKRNIPQVHIKLTGTVSFATLIGISVVSSYHYYLADRVLCTTTVFMDLYRYVFPSVYLILCLVYIYCFDVYKGYKQTNPVLKQVIINPIRILDCFRRIQYPMYLFHTIVMYCLKEVYTPGMYDGSLRLLGISPDRFTWAQGVLFVVYSFVLAVILSLAVSYKQEVIR